MWNRMHLRSILKLTIILPLICFLLCFDSFGQTQQSGQAAQKFDEFDDIQSSDKKARLDNFAIQLQSQPETRGFIIVYRSRNDLPGLNSRFAGLMKDYLVNSRGIPAERLITVDGGAASCLTQELWIAPAGTAPKPRGDAYSRSYVDTESVRKFDEFSYYFSEEDADGVGSEEVNYSLEAFAEALSKEPRSQAYIIAYPQYYVERRGEQGGGRRAMRKRRVYLDPPGMASRMLNEMMRGLVKKYRIASSRVRVVNGGYRRQREIELWIVPRGEHAPIATPNSFPKGR